jgi:radical SAM superfamily enzyme YgiQ (UPF0313 family)
MDIDTFTNILTLSIGENTLCVGFSVSWFISATGSGDYKEYDIDFPDGDIWDLKKENVYASVKQSVMYEFSQGNTDKVIDIVKNINPNTKVVLGGSNSYAYINKSKKIDNIFIGFSENQFPTYIDNLSKNKIGFSKKIVDFDSMGVEGNFDFRSAVVSYDESDYIQKNEMLSIEFTRGCIFNCAFCSFPHRGQKTKNFIRYKESIKQELLDNYQKWGVTKYNIVDDTFNDHTEKLELIAEVISELDFQPMFWAYCRLDLIGAHPEQAQLMKDIGVRDTLYGLETWHEPTAKLIKKGTSNKKKIKGMQVAKEVWGDDVNIDVSLITGLPEDTKQSWYDFLKFVKTEGHRYLNGIGASPLFLRSDDGFNNLRIKSNNLSEIEKNFEKYGYSFPCADIGQTTNWVRIGNGDINSFEKAQEVADYINTEVSYIQQRYRSKFFKDEIFNDMKKIIYPEHTDTYFTNWEIVNKWCTDYYFPFLTEHLRSKQ